jgi:adenosylcobinamide-GDP ribazoletransferase
VTMHTVQREIVAFMGAVRFFTRIPVSDRIPHTADSLNHSARYFPAIGLLVGTVSAIAFSMTALVLPTQVAVLIAMVSSIYLTGAFHEDGLSDMSDGLGGGWDKMRILEIMKDSRVGSYGVIAITMALLGKFVLLDSFDPHWVPILLITAHAFSRYCAVLIMAGLTYVREDRLSKSKPLATKITRNALWVASAFGLLPLLLLPANAALMGVAVGLLATIWLGRKLQKWLGGYTGDCLGATQQLSELAFYLGALAVLS